MVEKVRESKDGLGFNAATGGYEDLVAAGVIDPKKVTRCALQNAASVASLLLTTEVAIGEVPMEEGYKPQELAGSNAPLGCFRTMSISPPGLGREGFFCAAHPPASPPACQGVHESDKV